MKKKTINFSILFCVVVALFGSCRKSTYKPVEPLGNASDILQKSKKGSEPNAQNQSNNNMTPVHTNDYNNYNDYSNYDNYMVDVTPQWQDCSICMGSGACKYCGGTGQYEYSDNGSCGVCYGSGLCSACGGAGGYM